MNELKLPEPDTHCLDDEGGRPIDVWSYSPELVRQIVAADRALRESSYTEQDVNGILNACSGAYYPMALEAVVRRTLGVPAP